MEYPKFKVCCRCFTFNQSKYITDAMNGFTMQQTSFPFVCTIVDDASTDGEQDVIRKYVEDNFDFTEDSVSYHKETDYAHFTYAQHKTNKNCYFAVLYLKENHYSQRKPKMGYLSEWRDMCEYEALCEGDDYWICAQKLQKQVTYLDEHREVAYTCHRYNILTQSLHSIRLQPDIYFDKYKEATLYEFDNDYVFNVEWVSKTLTCVFRIKYFDPIFLRKFEYGRDVHMVYNILQHGKGICFADVMGVYRLNEESTFGGLAPRKRMETSYAVYKELWEETHDKLFLKKTIETHGYKMYAFGIELPHNIYQFCAFFDFAKRKLNGLCNHIKRIRNGKTE